MLNSNHPDDELLSALASRDTDATADTTLATHVASCDRCTDLVNELGALRVSLAELPDLAPSRPLRLLPPVEATGTADRAGAWARRLFAPALTAGAALAMVGLVGTAVPTVEDLATGSGDAGAQPQEVGQPAAEDGADAEQERELDEYAAHTSQPIDVFSAEGGGAPASSADRGAVTGVNDHQGDADRLAQLPAERSPWPMVLFTGLAVMIAAALLRWILVPRAG